MICSVKTMGISGIRGSAVTAECYISSGLPGFDIVGLPGSMPDCSMLLGNISP